jgi:two-component system, OmpR family, copper resistance phosphate regulon response regulator CusR
VAPVRVLVIEDEPRIRAFLARGLAAEGLLVDESVDGRSGLLRALEEEYDLVILDLLLPELDGLSVLRALHDNRPSLPVLILSARSDLRTKLRSFEFGADDYLAKPFSFEELLARVRVQLKRKVSKENGSGTKVRAGKLVLDLATRRAELGETVADLTAREFQLLLKLAEHAGEVVSRERLLSEVWGYHFDPSSNVVEVCIRRLRKKLGPGAPIQTVRHAGYRVPAA